METGKRRAFAVALAALAVGTGDARPLRAAPDSALTVFALDGETRLRRSDDPADRGQALPEQGGELLLQAFPGETAAFQIALVAGARPVAVARLEVGPLGGKAAIAPVVFREHYLAVSRRSFNEARPGESLGWTPAARPRDAEMLGEVPDALVPSTVDARPIAPGPDVPAGRTASFWVDVTVPETAEAGEYTGTARAISESIPIATFAIRLRVRGPALPYRATSAFVYYEPDRLVKRLGAAQAPAAERQLWQLLHAHRLDAIAPLADAETATRLQDAYDGSLFRPEAGYQGAGVGVPPAVVALGTYGVLGDPSPASFARLDAVLASLPLPALRAADLFVYAIDERCASPRAGEWRRLLAAHADAPGPGGGGTSRGAGPAVLRGVRVLVGQTCDDPPSQQNVDVALLPAAAFARTTGEEARGAGRRAWIYNGSLPRTGTLLLDADPRGLTANGWIAAVSDIERWFYWESTFWDDDNRGGRGAIDPFVTAESFHNTDGDSALGDGLLLYPGTQTAPFSAHSLGRAAVLPSLRLKALRRGLEDAAIIALAAREHPDETARLVAEALPAALDEAPFDRPASWATAPKRFGETRAALRALVTRTDAITSEEIRAGLGRLAAMRRRTIAAVAVPVGARPSRTPRRLAVAVAAMVLALGSLAVIRRRRRRQAG